MSSGSLITSLQKSVGQDLVEIGGLGARIRVVEIVEMALEGIHVPVPLAPERVEPDVEFDERNLIQAVDPPLGRRATGDKPVVSQYFKVLRHGRLTQPQGPDQLTDASFLLEEFVQDSPPDRVGDDSEDIGGHPSNIPPTAYTGQGMNGLVFGTEEPHVSWVWHVYSL
jgi:hypothetical protein